MFLIAFILSYALADGQSIERICPSNTAVVAGNQFYLVCENHSDKLTWRFKRANTLSESLIYNGTLLSHEFGDFQVYSTADGLSNLNKRVANIDDAGTYTCIQRHGRDYVVCSAQVIVFATDPLCSPMERTVVEGHYLDMNCSVHYIGSLSPIMKWSMIDRINSNFDANITNIRSSSSVISILKIEATKSDNNAAFKCSTYFKQPVISEENQTTVKKASNAPTYEHQCTHRLNVLSEPDVVNITPKKDVYTLGDVLLCEANGNPTPTYEWRELLSNSVVSKGSSLTVDSTAMENNAYKCTATNNATGKETSIYTTVTILAIIRSPIGSTGVVRSISIAAGTVFAILCFIIVLTVGIKRLIRRVYRDQVPQKDATADLDKSVHHLSHDESIDYIGTLVNIESACLEGDRPFLSEHQETSMDFDNIVQRPEENQNPPSDPDRTCYATLGDRSTPPPAVYENLKVQELVAKEANAHACENTPENTCSITTCRHVEFFVNFDHETYANVNVINLVVSK